MSFRFNFFCDSLFFLQIILCANLLGQKKTILDSFLHFFKSHNSELEATDDPILSSDFVIDYTVHSLILNEREKRSSIYIFTLTQIF